MKETQASVVQWVHEMFQDSHDLEYRALMVTEEAVELVLACGVSPKAILRCVQWALAKVTETNDLDHAKEEVGDVLSTLYALAHTIDCDAHAELDRKMAFNRTRPKSYYAAKTASKREVIKP